ncbi:MAG: hypothetical protein OEX18_08105 [Candidatus Krumholzibacteria bacterium]|nr:hypothetical protein [Candidatus Krumholzibacteria bacterium]MDH4337227.1 hypothetical protein [Candidatus Krumholzibacteria bacterium]MDH5268689.1 hypothetical protein [Candidatus Krumholzibacteria bacterium]
MRQATNRRDIFHSGIVAMLGGLLALPLLLIGGCRDSAPDDVIVQEESTDAIVFVKTKGEETLNRSWAEGNLYKLSPISPNGVVTPITNFTGASISDPCVSYDGKKILFSMRPPGGGNRNIYEINADGTGLRQVTTGGGHDFDPLYLPDGNIMFTSSRAGHMDEYNHSPAENLYCCNADGSNLRRVSFNMSDDFDPTLLPDGRVVYTRWDHFGTFNRFPLFFAHPDGSQFFHEFGPHNRNFFHAQPTPDGRLIAIESTMINEDAGPIAVLKLEQGPADPTLGGNSLHWDVLTPQVNNDGAPWAYGAFKYPFPLGGNKYMASYTLPAAQESDVDYGLYTFTLKQTGAGTLADPATITIEDLTFLYNDPAWNEYDAQLLAAHPKPPVIPTITPTGDSGVILAEDIFNRSVVGDGQEVPVKGVDPVTEIAVIVGIPTVQGEMNDFSANEFEKRALLGFAPVQPDGSFRIRVPANTPVTFAPLDNLRRAFINKRTWLYVQPGEEITNCVGCHEDRSTALFSTNPNPAAASMAPTDLNIPASSYTHITYRDDIGPIVEAKCVSCHVSAIPPDSIPPAGGLDLTAVPDTTMENRIFPRAYINLSGESEMGPRNVTVPAFGRRSILIDYVLGVGAAAGQGPHPQGADALTPTEQELFNLWVTLGAQYR